MTKIQIEVDSEVFAPYREDIRLSAAADIAKWLRSSVLSARYGSESWHLRRLLAAAIESGDWLIPESNEGPR